MGTHTHEESSACSSAIALASPPNHSHSCQSLTLALVPSIPKFSLSETTSTLKRLPSVPQLHLYSPATILPARPQIPNKGCFLSGSSCSLPPGLPWPQLSSAHLFPPTQVPPSHMPHAPALPLRSLPDSQAILPDVLTLTPLPWYSQAGLFAQLRALEG